MIPWNEYKAEAKARGSLAMEVFIIESTPSEGLDAVKSNLHMHLAYQTELESLGILMFAGPISDPSGQYMDGTGFIIYRARTFEEANDFALKDPMHSSGARKYSIKRWLINEGSLQLDIKLSAQSVCMTVDK